MARGDASEQIPQIDPQALTEEQKREAAALHGRLFGWLLALPEGLRDGRDTTLLLSRQSASHMWEQTGLAVDSKVNMVYGKIGTHAYQPLGRDNGEYFVPIQASQIFWAREFVLASVTPLAPAFEVEAPTPALLQERDPVAFSDEERALMQSSHDELSGALHDYVEQLTDYRNRHAAWKDLIAQLGSVPRSGNAVFDTPVDEPTHPDEMVFDTIKLESMRNVRIEKYLSEYDAAFHSQNGKSMYALAREGHTFHAIAKALTEWISMKLTDDQARRLAVSELKVTQVDQAQAALMGSLQRCIVGAVDGTADEQALALDTVYSASVTLRTLIERLRGESADQLTIFQTVRSVLAAAEKDRNDQLQVGTQTPSDLRRDAAGRDGVTSDQSIPPSAGNPG